MDRSAEPAGRNRWIAPLAIAALAVGLATAWWYLRPVAPPESARVQDDRLIPPDDSIHRGLRPAAVDSAEIKSRWVDEVPNFDLAGLDSSRREIFIRFANAERCTCGCGFTLAACRVYDSSCEVSTPRVQTLLDSVRAGLVTSLRGIRKRPA